MQKKTRSSKSRSKLRDLFWFAIAVCFAGAVLNSFLFYKSFFRALTKLNEEPIATITFKYKVAQRKFIDRVVWDRLRQSSPVYNGDTIHTQALSEATIWFTDGNVMELDENTMAQVFLTETDGAGANLTQGNATVDSSEAEYGFTISSYGVQAVVSSGSSVNASTAGETSLQVLKGNAEVTTKEGVSNVAGGESVSVNEEGYASENPLLIVSSPSPNGKILGFDDDKTTVNFEWTAKNIPENSSLVLVIARDKEFKNIIERMTVTGLTEASVKLSDGTYNWQLKTETASFSGKTAQEATARGRFTVNQSFSPELVTPVKDYEYTYRNRKPGVRFIWHESKYASTYRLVVATDNEMKNIVLDQRSSSNSSIISSLGQGVYYWQVTPFYTINKIGLASPSKIQRFVISQKGEMNPPELYLPSENGIVDTDPEGKGVNFSWKAEKEAVSYTVRIADNPELKNAKVSETTENNYISFSANSLNRRNIKDGKWYWTVTQTDDEGNVSDTGEVRTFFAMKGKPLQRAIEPLDGYMVAESLVRDLTFTWKRNLPETYVTKLQISKKEDFSKTLYDEVISGSKLKGFNFNKGEYFWRIISTNSLDNSVLETEPRIFKVVENLDAPKLISPLGRAVARESIPYKFFWNDVEGADFYKFSIYKSSNDDLVYTDTVYGNTVEVDMYGNKWQDKGFYYYQVQAQAMAVPGVSSRRNGNLAKNDFQLIKLKPVEITAPSKGKKIPGLEAIMNPPSVTWQSVEKCKTAQIIVRLKDTQEPVFVYPSDDQLKKELKVAPSTVKINTPGDYGLRSGDYEVIVKAETFDGIDISNTDEKNIGRFTVLPVEPLEETTNLTVTPEELNRDYILSKKSTAVTFRWAKVHNATDYYFVIYNSKNKPVIKQRLNTTSYVLEFAKLDAQNSVSLKKGSFTWTVEAVRRIDTDKDGILDKVLQEGKIAKGKFRTDIPTPKKSTAKGAINPYGK